jgi:uncharacterized protein (TIGR03089 family)
VHPTTFPRVLADQCARAGSRPLVTFYDDATGERVELSVVTYANWVAKTAGLLQDELGLERGDTLLVDLPTHWLAPVMLGAAWSAGLVVTADPGTTGGAVVCGPAGVDRWSGAAMPVVAVSLRPLGAPFAEPLPEGVVDYGAVVWGQPDAFLALDEPAPDDLAWVSADRRATQAELLRSAGSGAWSAPGTRLLTDADPRSATGAEQLLAPLLAGGGTVWVANPDPGRWDDRARAEQATAVSSGQPRS